MLKKPDTCRPCELYGIGWGYSKVSGDGRVPLLIVAEASGKNEERLGRPLVETAPAGGVFEKALEVSGLKRSDYLVTNILRCRPPGNELKGAPYERAAIDHCRQYLDAVVAERQPKFILALGDVPLRELSTIGGGVSSLRGFVLQSRYEDVKMLSTYHPSYLARGAFSVLFGVFMHDLRRAHQFATRGVPEPLPTNYILSPTEDDVRAYLERLRTDVTLPVAYDVETEEILGVPGPKDWREKKLIQIQFSSEAGEALVLPWNEMGIEATRAVMATENMKWDWNGRLSDRLVLRANGITLNGELHDLMNAHGHLQPDFGSNKDDTDGDKGVPAKLMSLQSCLSFYYPEEGPYKGMVQRAIDATIKNFEESEFYDPDRTSEWVQGSTAVWNVLRYYGAKDADYTFRLGVKLFDALKRGGLW